MLLSKLQRSCAHVATHSGRASVTPLVRRAMLPAVPRQTGRTKAVQVLAYRRSEKSEKLMAAAREFIDCWAQGCKAESVSNTQMLRDLADICDANIKVQAVHPLGNVDFQGFEGLKKKLEQDANFKSSMRPNRVLLAAVDESERSVFCLLECEEMGSMDEDVNLVLLELHCVGKTYGIVKLDIDVAEDGTPKVKAVTERMQLGPADAFLLHMLYPESKHAEDIATHKDSTGRVALQMASTWHFPREEIRPTPLKGVALEAAKKNMQAWCDARSSGNDAQRILTKVVDPESFGLWDPFGVLPTVCGVRDSKGRCTYQGIQADSHANCIMSLESVVNRLNAVKETHRIKCDMVGSALCANHNVGFTYWHSSMKQVVHTKSGAVVDDHDYPIEAMAVHIFLPDGRIKQTWMLRDPYEIEKQMMESLCESGKI